MLQRGIIISGNLSGAIFKLLDLRVFQSGFYHDPSRNDIGTGLIYIPIIIIIMIALHKWKSPWWQKILVLFMLLEATVHLGGKLFALVHGIYYNQKSTIPIPLFWGQALLRHYQQKTEQT